jgi:dephospho-CoA kinase
MLTIAVTGGVACGKSEVCRGLRDGFPRDSVSYVSCDAVVLELLENPEIIKGIVERGEIWRAALEEIGGLNRNRFRELLFENSQFRESIEGLLHPLVLERVSAHLKGQSGNIRVTLIEVPLLYEVNFPVDRDLDLAVAASESTQMGRICSVRGLAAPLAMRIIESQLPIKEKIQRADIVVWNDGDRRALEAQTDHLVSRCLRLFN